MIASVRSGPRRYAAAALAGLAMGLARTMATRQAAHFYKKSAGHLPDAMRNLEGELDKVS